MQFASSTARQIETKGSTKKITFQASPPRNTDKQMDPKLGWSLRRASSDPTLNSDHCQADYLHPTRARVSQSFRLFQYAACSTVSRVIEVASPIRRSRAASRRLSTTSTSGSNRPSPEQSRSGSTASSPSVGQFPPRAGRYSRARTVSRPGTPSGNGVMGSSRWAGSDRDFMRSIAPLPLSKTSLAGSKSDSGSEGGYSPVSGITPPRATAGKRRLWDKLLGCLGSGRSQD